MVSENEYDVMMFMMYVQVNIYKQGKQVLRFRLACSLIAKYPLEV